MVKVIKGFLILIFILLVSVSGSAAPFLVSDPQAGVTNYVLTGPAWVPASVLAQTNGSLRMDVANAATGTNSLTIKACYVDALWGNACSASVPFVFTRPSQPATTSGIKLTP